MKTRLSFILICLFFFGMFRSEAQPKTLEIKAGTPIAPIQSTMWGLFFEDINFAADGGIYAELIKNRSFEFYKPLMGWKVTGEKYAGQLQIISRPNNDNPRFLRLESLQGKELGLVNEGFRGMGVSFGENYLFSILARQSEGVSALKIDLLDSTGVVIGTAEMKNFSGEWKKYEAKFACSATDSKAKLRVTLSGKGVLEIDMVSLFPEHTWKNRKNGLRADLVQKLADLKPGFLRFPGGCIVEGRELATRYQWKKTVGNVEDRQLIVNRWNTEFSYRNAPDYFQSYGLGFYEYFLLSEDLGAEPLPILNCGMACEYNSCELAPLDGLDPYIQDILDLIEFANGATTTKWGKLRVEMGHPEPFNLKMVGVGNEQWGTQYIDRLKIILKVLREKHPEITYVGGSGPSPDGKDFDYLWAQMRELKVPMVDEHYYRSPDWFLKNVSRYDSYDRKGPKVFAGEYAAHDKEGKDPESRNTWKSALAEAALMTGLERNADVVYMASYAPLLGNVNAWQWRPDLIWFDNLKSVATPNYYVQKLFSTNAGTDVVLALVDGKPLTGQDSLYASACVDSKTSELIVKLVNVAKEPSNLNLSLEGRKALSGEISLQVLTNADPAAYNFLGKPEVLVPVKRKLKLSGKKIVLNLDGYSLTVVRIPLKK
ncbi:MAG TPA: alpha-L-arabinofuranosidase C-terminal domain-containing protein [Prolixibacteraceae bacterium]|nr:alpha-L-arabinofuranosidase C-terminal domain-containing protein [Prolixibacteraceae bacterium]